MSIMRGKIGILRALDSNTNVKMKWLNLFSSVAHNSQMDRWQKGLELLLASYTVEG